MKKFILALSITALAAAMSFAQADDYKKGEGYIGYSNAQVDTGIDSDDDLSEFFNDRVTLHGVNVSGVYNMNRYFGLKGDISAAFNSRRDTVSLTSGGNTLDVSAKTNNSLYNFVGGVQLKDNSREGRFKPFAHAMVGGAHARTKINDFVCEPSNLCAAVVIAPESFNSTGFSGVFGGGLDIRVSDRFQVRAFQVDYNPTRIEGITQHNARFGAGIVF